MIALTGIPHRKPVMNEYGLPRRQPSIPLRALFLVVMRATQHLSNITVCKPLAPLLPTLRVVKKFGTVTLMTASIQNML